MGDLAAGGLEPIDLVPDLRGRGPVALLDGGLDADGLGRYSYLGSEPSGALFAWGDRLLEIDSSGHRRRRRGDPFVALEARVEAMASEADDDGPRFRRGAIGWLGYELGRRIERLPAPQDDRSMVPDLAFWFFDDVLAHDRVTGGFHGGSGRIREALRRARPGPRAIPELPPGVAVASDFDRVRYCAAVERVREYIAAGDVYQVNLSQRFRGRLGEDPFTLYRRLRARRPAPLGALIEAGSRAVLSNSPELFLRVRGCEVETRPIKGTRPRGCDPAEDARLSAELLASAKDRAELTMIVDLMRNDLGKVAAIGSVEAVDFPRLVTLPTVHHLVATVRARLAPGVGTAALLRATFPGGSVTGCPKIRAMERIAELEPCRRGVYTGAIGWIAPGGDLELNVAIRTLTVAGGRFSFHAGGGVVYDSDPEAEYDETLAKARAWLEALGVGAPEWPGGSANGA